MIPASAGTGPPAASAFDLVARIEVDPDSRVLEHGWQSWSPTGWYPATAGGPQPRSPQGQTMGSDRHPRRWQGAFQSEGVSAVQLADQSVVVGSQSLQAPASIRAWVERGRLLVAADEEVTVEVCRGDPQLELREWARRIGEQVEMPPLRELPSGWCSWYCFERSVSEAAVLAELEEIERRDLPVEAMLIDEGYERALGDWLVERDGFGDLFRLARSLRSSGKLPGIWVAPFVASAASDVVRRHPDWWLRGVSAGHVWDSDLVVLDAGSEAAVCHVADTCARLAEAGFGLFKFDFLYAGVLPAGRSSWQSREDTTGYRHVLSAVRAAIGPEPYLVGCGASMMPSIGLFDGHESLV
jgi:alpha-galactosidase